MRSKFILTLLVLIVSDFVAAADSLSFSNSHSTRAISLSKDVITYDTLKGQSEEKKIQVCVQKQFYLEGKKLLKYPSQKCSHQNKIVIEIEGIKRAIHDCSLRLPRYEETLVKILNCGK